MTVVAALVTVVLLVIVGYFLVYLLVNMSLTVIGLASAERQVTVRRPSNLDRTGASPLTPMV